MDTTRNTDGSLALLCNVCRRTILIVRGVGESGTVDRVSVGCYRMSTRSVAVAEDEYLVYKLVPEVCSMECALKARDLYPLDDCWEHKVSQADMEDRYGHDVLLPLYNSPVPPPERYEMVIGTDQR